MSLGPGLHQATKSHLKMLHNWFFKNVVELRMFTNSFLSLIQTCSTAAAAVLLFWLQTVLLRCKQFLMFLCVCGLVGGVLEIPHCTGSGKSWGRYRVQAPGACTKLSQNSRFVSRDNMHTQREIERHRPRDTESFPTYLCNYQLVFSNICGLLRAFESAD